MDNQRECCRHILLFHLRNSKNTVQARKKLCEVCGENRFTECQCQCWLARFRSVNLNVQDAFHAGRTIITDDDKITCHTPVSCRTHVIYIDNLFRSLKNYLRGKLLISTKLLKMFIFERCLEISPSHGQKQCF